LDLEQKKKELEIELVYFNDPNLEKNKIAIAEVGRMFADSLEMDYEKDKKAFEKFVAEKVASDSMDLGKACLQIADMNIVDSIANQYNQFRVSSLQDYLITVNDSTEIKVFLSKPEAPKNISSKPIFDIKYGMKEEFIN
jgi:hypothetical protein